MSKGILPCSNQQVRFLQTDLKSNLNKSDNNTSLTVGHIPNALSPILDTIRNNCPDTNKNRCCEGSKEQNKWIRRSASKALTVHLSSKLRNYVKDKLSASQRHRKDDWLPWVKRYSGSMFCCHRVEQIGSKLQSMYCRQKWCSVCGRNRGAKIVEVYGKEFEGLKDLYHVGLSIKSMPGDQLALSIDRMNLTWRKIYNSITRKGIKPKGGRSLEVTHGIKGYHPHYHILISGLDNAMMIQSLWMKHFKDEANQAGQYVSPVKPDQWKNSVLELVKYAVKPLVNDEVLPSEVLHTINVATFGRQMFSSFGIKKVKPQEIEAPEIEVSKVDWIKPKNTVYNWDHNHREWINKDGLKLVRWSNKKVDDILRGRKNRKKTVNKIGKVDRVDTYKVNLHIAPNG